MAGDGAGGRHDGNARHLPGMDVAETTYLCRVIQVSGVPGAFHPGVGTQADHTERTAGG